MDGVRTHHAVGFIITLFTTYVSGGGVAAALLRHRHAGENYLSLRMYDFY
jgi:hypothetical protein